jgi:hypothetical protein
VYWFRVLDHVRVGGFESGAKDKSVPGFTSRLVSSWQKRAQNRSI